MHQARILASFVLDQPSPYVPQFSVKPTDLGFEIWDDSHKIGHFNMKGWFFLDLWSFSPFEPPIYANRRENPHVRDIHTCRNTNLNLPYGSSADLIAGVEDPHAAFQLEWVSESGPMLRWRLRAEFSQGQRIVYDLRIIFDADWGRYRVYIDADAWKVAPTGFEPINFMMVHAVHSRPQKRRWSHSVWEDPHGQLRRLVHSNALFTATDFGMDSHGGRRTKNAPADGAWIAYAPHPDFNPALIVHDASAPLAFATCSQLFDEHLLLRDAGLESLDGSHFHFRLHTELVNMDPELAQALLDEAVDPKPPSQWLWERCALPFHIGVVNSLEAPVDPWIPQECPILVVDTDPNATTGWVEDASRSGHRSLVLNGRGPGKLTSLHPSGAVCNVEPDTRYTFSAWVRTEGVNEHACLTLSTYRYTYDNTIKQSVSEIQVSGNSEWTFISVSLDAGEEAYMLPRMELRGEGRAYFDDLIFTEESKGRGSIEDTASLGPLPID